MTARLALIVIVFGLIGITYALNKSQAATRTVQAEAEYGMLAGNAIQYGKSDASGSAAVRFGNTSTMPPVGRILQVAKTGAQYTSIQTAANAAQPGDTILIADGTYSEALNPVSGTDGKPITFQARVGARVIVDGNKANQSGNGLMNLDDRSWLKFSGITFTRSPTHGIYGFRAHDIVFENCEVDHSSNGGLVMLGSSNITVDGCNIHNNNELGLNASHEAITMAEATTNYEIKNCIIHDNLEEGVAVKYDSNAGRIHDNIIFNNNETNLYANSSSDLEIYNNKIYSTLKDKKSGIVVGIEDFSTSRQAGNIQIYNNLIYNNLDGGIAFWRQSDGLIFNITVTNNTIVNNPGGGFVGIDQLASNGNVARNNIFFNNNSGIASPMANDSNYTQDPKFIDQTNHDYHLSASSGAVNAGTATGAPTFDHDNKPRPQGNKVDIGAYER